MESKKYKITYLLGAGASANAIPTVKDFKDASGKKVDGLSESMLKLAEKLEVMIKSNDSNKNNNIASDNIEIANDFVQELKNLSTSSNKFGSVDTYAKYLYHTNRTNLIKLKKTLSNYFIYKQSFEKKFDNRYLTFLISILNENGQFPDNIKIISWNYDSQLQMAAKEYKENADFHSYPINRKIDSNLLSLVQLNGVVGFYTLNGISVDSFSGDILDINYFFKHIDKYDKYFRLLSFAWEKENDTESILVLNERVEKAKYVIQKTDILVIVGYSFPFFNREIDNELFKTFKEGGLKKIYYQDPFNNGKFLRNQFNLSTNIEIEHFEKVDNFLLPLEL